MNLIRSLVRRVLRRPVDYGPPPGLQVWSIGIYAGRSPYHLTDAPGVTNPVLTCNHVSDVPAHFVADPFMLHVNGMWYMFLEVMNAHTGKGQIGLAVSDDAARWRYQGIVLNEHFHLAYPYVFSWMGEHYIIPDSYSTGSVRLYRARRFPWDWVFVKTLVEGNFLVDSSIVQVDGRWWMFVQTSSRYDTLCLYDAPSLTGPWREHPASPIIAGDPHVARPAGRVIVHDGRVIRFTQDCHAAYGLAVRAFEVDTLTADAYLERPIGPDPMLVGSGAGWNADGMHHVDPHPLADGDWIACVDGWVGYAQHGTERHRGTGRAD